MKRFIIKKSQDEFYTLHSGIALIGLCLNRYTNLSKSLAGMSSLKKGASSHADVVRSYIGLLCLAKSDFAAIEGFRQDRFFREALGLKEVPSEPTLRQRLEQHAQAFHTTVNGCVTEFLQKSGALFSALATGHVPLDIDVLTQDNSGTKKQGVSRTYQGFDGFAPIASYLALEGWLLEIDTVRAPSTVRRTSSRNPGAIATHVERRSRYLKASLLENRKAETFNAAATPVYQQLPEALRQTLTVDNGKVFAFQGTGKQHQAQGFLCRPLRRLAAGNERKHQWPAAILLPQGNRFQPGLRR